MQLRANDDALAHRTLLRQCREGFQIGGVVGTLTLGYILDRTTPAATLAAVFVIGSTSIFLIGYADTSVVLLRIAVFIAGFCLLGAMTGMAATRSAIPSASTICARISQPAPRPSSKEPHCAATLSGR